jgi:hypothetical protein
MCAGRCSYERHVEATHEESRNEQQVAAMLEGLPNRVAGGQSSLLYDLPASPTTLESHGERGNDHHGPGEQQERGLPTVVSEERLPEWSEHELPERTCSGRETHGLRAPVSGNKPSQSGDDDGERGTGEPEANEYAGREVEG